MKVQRTSYFPLYHLTEEDAIGICIARMINCIPIFVPMEDRSDETSKKPIMVTAFEHLNRKITSLSLVACAKIIDHYGFVRTVRDPHGHHVAIKEGQVRKIRTYLTNAFDHVYQPPEYPLGYSKSELELERVKGGHEREFTRCFFLWFLLQAWREFIEIDDAYPSMYRGWYSKTWQPGQIENSEPTEKDEYGVSSRANVHVQKYVCTADLIGLSV